MKRRSKRHNIDWGVGDSELRGNKIPEKRLFLTSVPHGITVDNVQKYLANHTDSYMKKPVESSRPDNQSLRQ